MSKKSDVDKVKIIPLSEVARRRGVTMEVILAEAIEGKIVLHIKEGGWGQRDMHSGDVIYAEFGELKQIVKNTLNDILNFHEADLHDYIDIYTDNTDLNKVNKISLRQYTDKKKKMVITKESLFMIDDGIADNTLNEFAEMNDLQWDEIGIKLLANGVIYIQARGKHVRVTSGEFGLLNKNTGKPNEIYVLLAMFAEKQSVGKNKRMTVTRVRSLLKEKIGINKTPIELVSNRYQPLFKISMDADTSSTKKNASASFELGDDQADEWLAENDPNN